jgi:hypothetical protein
MTDNERERGPFEKALHAHDWYYAYSDDHSVWVRGQASVKALQAQHEALKCPFSLLELNTYVHKRILEQFEEIEPGKFWRKGKDREYVAACRHEDLIPQAKADEITAWLDENDK